MTKRYLGLFLFIGIVAFSACKRTNDHKVVTSEQLDSLLLKGIHQTRNLEFEQSYETLTFLLSEAKYQNSAKHQVRAYLNLGVLYLQFGNDNEALKYLFESLRVSEEENFTQHLNAIYNNLGVVYSENHSYAESLKYFTKAMEFSTLKQDSAGIGMNLLNMGVSYLNLKRYDESRAHLIKAQEMLEGRDRPDVTSDLHQTLGKLDLIDGDYEKALSELKVAYEIGYTANYQLFALESKLFQAKAYLALNQLDSAEHYTQTALKGFGEIDNKNLEIEAYELLGQIALAKEEFELAKLHFLEIVSLKDSLLYERKIKWVNESQINYELGKKESKIESLEIEAEKERAIWIAGIIVSLIIVLLIIVVLRTINRNLRQKNVILRQDKQVTALEIEKKEALNDKLKQTMLRREEISELEKQRMLDELEHKNRELVSKAMHLVNKNETLTSIQNSIAHLKSGNEKEKADSVKEIEATLRAEKTADDEWENFRLHFEEVHPGFFKMLSDEFPDLNFNDQRMCAYFKLGLAAKEIAQILNISPDSIRKRKQRLKEKLNFKSSKELITWLK